MKTAAAAGLALVTLPAAVLAQDHAEYKEAVQAEMINAGERCVSPVVLVPPFNNSPGALEQSRVAATTVESVRERRGEAYYKVCKSSALTPQISEIEGVDEEPLTEEEMREIDPEANAPAADSGA